MTRLHIIVYPSALVTEPDGSGTPIFVAAAVEKFLVAQGRTVEEALEMLEWIIAGTIFACRMRNQDFTGISEAPEGIKNMLAQARVNGDPGEVRPAIEDLLPVVYRWRIPIKLVPESVPPQ